MDTRKRTNWNPNRIVCKGRTFSELHLYACSSLLRERWLMGGVRNAQALEHVAETSAVSVATFFAEAQRIEPETMRDGDEARDGLIADDNREKERRSSPMP